MPTGVMIDGISFSEIALVDRPDHAAVLGRIFTSWSLIEGTIAGLLGLMMHTDQRAALAILATFRTNSSRVQAVRSVGKEMLDAPIRSEFDDLMKAVLSYANERNAIAHNLWGVKDGEPGVVYRMPMTALSNFVIETPQLATIDAEEIVASFKSQMTSFTVSDLEQIEQRGRDVLTRVMTETTKRGYSRFAQNKHPDR